MKLLRIIIDRYHTIIVLLLAIPVWAGIVELFKIPPFLVPSPATVWRNIIQYRELLASNFLVTLRETLTGFCIGTALGLPLGVGMVLWRPLERTLYPFLIMLESTPKIAIAPLLVVWIGLGTTTRIVQASIVVFFPILINTAVGLRSTSKDMVDLLRSMGASPWQIFRKLQMPSALPSLFGGLKVALPLAVIGAIVAEFVGGSEGLGAMLLAAEGAFNTGLLFACIVILSLMGVMLFKVVETIEWLAIGEGVRRRRAIKQWLLRRG
jgi:NitT/TauT family transport system permease protein